MTERERDREKIKTARERGEIKLLPAQVAHREVRGEVLLRSSSINATTCVGVVPGCVCIGDASRGGEREVDRDMS